VPPPEIAAVGGLLVCAAADKTNWCSLAQLSEFLMTLLKIRSRKRMLLSLSADVLYLYIVLAVVLNIYEKRRHDSCC